MNYNPSATVADADTEDIGRLLKTKRFASNPFVGPRPLARSEPLHGRGAELEGLVGALMARRVVVLHSAAGAGKTSLIQAGLLRMLKQAQFDVWKPIELEPARAQVEDFAAARTPMPSPR